MARTIDPNLIIPAPHALSRQEVVDVTPGNYGGPQRIARCINTLWRDYRHGFVCDRLTNPLTDEGQTYRYMVKTPLAGGHSAIPHIRYSLSAGGSAGVRYAMDDGAVITGISEATDEWLELDPVGYTGTAGAVEFWVNVVDLDGTIEISSLALLPSTSGIAVPSGIVGSEEFIGLELNRFDGERPLSVDLLADMSHNLRALYARTGMFHTTSYRSALDIDFATRWPVRVPTGVTEAHVWVYAKRTSSPGAIEVTMGTESESIPTGTLTTSLAWHEAIVSVSPGELIACAVEVDGTATYTAVSGYWGDAQYA